jgi:glycosyl transferase family 87
MWRIPRHTLLLVFVLVGAIRFAYALTASPQGWTGSTYIENVYRAHRQIDGSPAEIGIKRRWGPLFLLIMDGYTRLPMSDAARRAILRLALTALYGVTLLLLMRTLPPERRLVLLGLGLQSTAAIYAITDGMGEIVSAACIVGHFCLFLDRRFWAAALVICAGVYFKVHPIVFLFPFFVFSMLSRDHRRYCTAVVVCGGAIAAVSIAAAGWRFGFFYPVTLIRSVVTDADLIPILSKEVFGPMSLVGRMASGFQVRPVDAAALALARRIAPIFTTLLVASTAAAALALAVSERNRRPDEHARRIALITFQAAIGFLMFAFSLDVSIGLLLPIAVSLYAPLWLTLSPLAAALFLCGTVLVGNLVPLSLLVRVMPFAMLDRMAGNPPSALIAHEKYMWYEVPMVGMLLLLLSYGAAWHATIRRDRQRPRSPGA